MEVDTTPRMEVQVTADKLPISELCFSTRVFLKSPLPCFLFFISSKFQGPRTQVSPVNAKGRLR